ncbi:DUF3108 domain-containing protein [Methylocapsa palsarum]|uniref:DUF3108 domain-containing protein n=1 Tax=Methylocapsa palsarum TaxID=1612308 RepID=A0A1I3VSW8_9HYPH|nr:DUF3108 domain-containing protein [Methylocapsa palsarum]SFJ98013.1 Protein of unknown function [Methylocapsa palsarum]
MFRRLCAFALAGCLGAAPASSEVVRAHYTVSLVGLHIGDAVAVGSIDPSSYRIDFNVHLTGVAAMVSNVKLALRSTGALRNGAVAPATFTTISSNDRETRTVRMSLNAGNVKAVDISPPWDDLFNRVPVTEAHKRNILDPLSAFVMAVPEGQPLVGASACNRTLPVYDGFVRFNVALSYVGTRDVSVSGYSGPVSVCAARYTPISGHKRDSRSAKFMSENREIEAWLAPLPHAHVVVPLRVALTTLAGAAVIEAVDFTIQASDVAATTAH